MQNTKRKLRKSDFAPFVVKNIVTGDKYLTCIAYEKKTIDGVTYTQVLEISPTGDPIYERRKYVRSDALKKG